MHDSHVCIAYVFITKCTTEACKYKTSASCGSRHVSRGATPRGWGSGGRRRRPASPRRHARPQLRQTWPCCSAAPSSSESSWTLQRQSSPPSLETQSWFSSLLPTSPRRILCCTSRHRRHRYLPVTTASSSIISKENIVKYTFLQLRHIFKRYINLHRFWLYYAILMVSVANNYS